MVAKHRQQQAPSGHGTAENKERVFPCWHECWWNHHYTTLAWLSICPVSHTHFHISLLKPPSMLFLFLKSHGSIHSSMPFTLHAYYFTTTTIIPTFSIIPKMPIKHFFFHLILSLPLISHFLFHTIPPVVNIVNVLTQFFSFYPMHGSTFNRPYTIIPWDPNSQPVFTIILLAPLFVSHSCHFPVLIEMEQFHWCLQGCKYSYQ